MKRYFLAGMIFFVATVFLCGITVAMMPDSAKIGVAAGIVGDVSAVAVSGEERVLKGGDPLFQGDTVKTGENAKMQILLLDQTVFTIGASSSIKLDEFVYDPESDEGKLNADILTGAFRFISGKIAHKKPENMSVDLPVGNIGIRGTFVAGQSEGNRSLVVLLGGPAGQGSGAINVNNMVNGQLVGVDINQGGFGTVIEGANVPPLSPFQVPLLDLMNLATALGQQISQSGTGQQGQPQTLGSGTGDAGNAPFPPDMNDLLGVLSTIDNMTQQSQTAAQDLSDNSALSHRSSSTNSDSPPGSYNNVISQGE